MARTEKHPSHDEILAAEQRAENRAAIEPRAESVHYIQKTNSIILTLKGGAGVVLPVGSIRELDGAKPAQLRTVRVDFGGEAITIDSLDVDISVPGLLRDLVGITSAATILGQKGGRARSDAKTAAVRANGKRGGRPPKVRRSA